MLDDELQEIADRQVESKYLKGAYLTLGVLILYGIVTYFAFDSFYAGHSLLWSRFLILTSYGLMGLSIIAAIMVLRTSFKCIKTSRSARNYIAIGISIFVLFIIAIDIMSRL